MKVRAGGNVLRRAVEGTARSGRPGFCIQCREERNGVSAMERVTGYVRRQALGGSMMGRRPRFILPATFIAGQRRALATVKNGTASLRTGRMSINPATVNPDDRGPLMEYDDRVDSGRLRNDEHQRG